MKKRISAILFGISVGLLAPCVHGSGIPTVDAAAITQMLQQLLQLQQMYQQLQQQYETAVSTLNNFSGTRGLGMLYYDPNLKRFLPEGFNDRMRSVIDSGVSALSERGLRIYNEQKMDSACSGLKNQSKLECEKIQAAKAEYQSGLETARDNVQLKYDNILKLQQAINSTTDSKAIQELSARIQSEQSTLAASQAATNYELAVANARIEQKRKDEAMKANRIFFGPSRK